MISGQFLGEVADVIVRLPQLARPGHRGGIGGGLKLRSHEHDITEVDGESNHAQDHQQHHGEEH